MHGTCMATKTISLRIEAYERLRRARLHPGESFSEVVMRARWPEKSITGRQLLRLVRERGAIFRADALAALDEMQAADAPPEDKWAKD